LGLIETLTGWAGIWRQVLGPQAINLICRMQCVQSSVVSAVRSVRPSASQSVNIYNDS